MLKAIDMRGQRFGRLVVRERSKRKARDAYWICDCDCGNETTVRRGDLIKNHIKSCGCLLREMMMRGLSFKHGQSHTPRWVMWRRAKERAKRDGVPFTLTMSDIPTIPPTCPVLGTKMFHNFGGKGGTKDSPTLDRIVPSLGYIPGNVEVISNRANQLKGNATLEEIRRIYEYVKEKTIGNRP